MMRIAIGTLAVMLLVSACADTDSAAEDSAAPTAPPGTATTPTAIDGHTSEGTFTIELEGVTWELPATACLAAPGDPAATMSAATAAAEEVRSLVATRASGWPTTTVAAPGGDAGFFVEINRWGPITLALGTVAGTRAELVASWTAFEQRYADPGGGWGPVTDITTRLTGWGVTADLLVAALAERC